MFNINNFKILLLHRKALYESRSLKRCYQKYISAREVRQQFLDYFIKDNNYNFLRSSPVVPYCDPTVPFVNAGMNQFKNVFLGNNSARYNKVANSQKCVRVGGKHNDLNVVGMDGYHHTFFEMLGNWTFGDCSKKDVCGLAWKLLTEVYKIDKNCLYVTYFGGNSEFGLAADLECREVWRSLGVPENRILPFGMTDNFWEMGLMGPCGPCTEIHFDHLGATNRAAFVNKGLHELVELWNLVFIEYNRNAEGKIVPLPSKHVDTGMGFERLVAIIQGKVSNYETDVFKYLFSAIQKTAGDIPKYKNYFGENDWNQLNSNYRILADHARMVTACLADGMIPESNQKLRKIIRRAFLISETTFKKNKGHLKELSNYVIDNLGHVYPEMEANAKQIHQIIDYEEEVYESIRKTASHEWSKLTTTTPALLNLDIIEMPGLVQAFKEIQTTNTKEITSELAYKLYDTYGLDEDSIGKLGKVLEIKFNKDDFRKKMDNVKMCSKQMHCHNINNTHLDFNKFGEKTDDSFKYDYTKTGDEYVFKDVPVQVMKILQGSEFVESLAPNVEATLILNKTNFYSEAGGQIHDIGQIEFDIGNFDIYEIKCINDYVLHKGILKSKLSLDVGSAGRMKFDEKLRLRNMQNHSATHLLNAALKNLKGATCQKSSKVTDKYLNLDVSVFGDKLLLEDVIKVERDVNRVINKKEPVKVREINEQDLLGLDKVTLIPGEVYPDRGMRLIEIYSDNEIFSRELCCGTHVLNTSDIKDFCVVSFKSLGRSTTSLHAVTGEKANLARSNGRELLLHIAQLQKNVDDNIDKPDVLEMAVAALKQQLNFNIGDDNVLPVAVKDECMVKLNLISKQIKEAARNSLKEFIDMEMQSVLHTKTLKSDSNKDFIVHYLRTSMILDSVPLQRATKNCQNLPVLVISYSDSIVKARCCVPESCIKENFNAEIWLRIIGEIFKSPVAPPKGQNAVFTCNLKGKKISMSDWHTLLKDSLDAAKLYAKRHL